MKVTSNYKKKKKSKNKKDSKKEYSGKIKGELYVGTSTEGSRPSAKIISKKI